jgi:hypothetical protein
MDAPPGCLPEAGLGRFQFSKTYIWKIVSYTTSFEQFLFEEMRRIVWRCLASLR